MLETTLARFSPLFRRQQLIPSYVKFVSPCQFGATPQMEVTLASHTLRSFLDVTRLHGHSSAVLHLDLSKAFV